VTQRVRNFDVRLYLVDLRVLLGGPGVDVGVPVQHVHGGHRRVAKIQILGLV